jgi:hypothetical protein
LKGAKKIGLYLTNGGGSHRIKLFRNEVFDNRFTGLHVKKLSETK